jgi:GH35 family endo-1,4-beta-xylanase
VLSHLSGIAGLLLTVLITSVCRAESTALDLGAVDARIREHRTGTVTITVTDARGRPLAGKRVTVNMLRHKFLFGCNLYRWGNLKDPQLEADYRRCFAGLFNYATLPFYWDQYEPERNKPREDRLRVMAQWCRRNGIRTKGHPLVWHEAPAPWQTQMDVQSMRRLQLERVRREISAFAGLIDSWDVVNEAVIMPTSPEPLGRLCSTIGPVKLIYAAFDVARQTNPRAVLILNDFKQESDYAKLIRESLQAKASIDVIGIQSHMHEGYAGARHLWVVCERFAHFGKPLHWTETTILSGQARAWWKYDPDTDWPTTPEGEQRQAAQVRDFYRLLFSHPAVEAITWWDLSDNDAWLSAPAGLLRKDMTPKPAYDALQKLILNDWWTGPLILTTDSEGRVTFRGFLGLYEIGTARSAARLRLHASGNSTLCATLEDRPAEISP